MPQEDLAERAGLSVAGLSALENGRRQAPYRHTVTLLASALGLSSPETARLEAAIVRVRVTAPATAPAPDGQGQESAPAQQTGGDASPPAPAPQPPRTNLPAALSSFIGREREQGGCARLAGRRRLVTLTGTGGVGKTRLALAVAGSCVDAYPDGVWLVELAPLADPALVPGAVAQVLGLREEPGRPSWPRCSATSSSGSCCWCWTIVSIWWRPAPRWRARCCGRCPPCASWPPAGRRWAWQGRQRYRVPSLSVPTRAPAATRAGRQLRGGAAVRGARAGAAGRLRADRAQCAGGGGDLRAAGWHPAGDRAGGGAGGQPGRWTAIAARLDQTASGCSPGWTAIPPCPPADPARGPGLELGPARARRSGRCCAGSRYSRAAGRWRRRRRSCAGDGIETREVLDLLDAPGEQVAGAGG